MLEKAVRTTLRTLDPRLSHMLLGSNRPDALRRFAHTCVEYAVRSGDVRDPVLARALDLAAAHAPTWLTALISDASLLCAGLPGLTCQWLSS